MLCCALLCCAVLDLQYCAVLSTLLCCALLCCAGQVLMDGDEAERGGLGGGSSGGLSVTSTAFSPTNVSTYNDLRVRGG